MKCLSDHLKPDLYLTQEVNRSLMVLVLIYSQCVCVRLHCAPFFPRNCVLSFVYFVRQSKRELRYTHLVSLLNRKTVFKLHSYLCIKGYAVLTSVGSKFTLCYKKNQCDTRAIRVRPKEAWFGMVIWFWCVEVNLHQTDESRAQRS